MVYNLVCEDTFSRLCEYTFSRRPRQGVRLTSGQNWDVVETAQRGDGSEARREGTMDLTPRDDDLLTAYLAHFTSLAGDARTQRLLRATVRGILGAESLCCARIAAFSPGVGRHPAW